VRVSCAVPAGVVLVATLAACGRSRDVLATVGGRPVQLAKVAAAIAEQSGLPFADVSPEVAAALFEDYLEEEVVLATSSDAADRGLSGTARAARARELLEAACPPPAPPTDAEVRAYLAAHPELQQGGERLLLRQLVLPDQASARAAQERARRGEDFVALSRALSRAPNAAGGGAIGWVERGQLPPEFEAAIFPLASGGVSAPVASGAGWHVVQVVERRSGGAADPSSLAAARSALAAETAERSRKQCTRAIAARVGVTIAGSAKAPFPLRNPFEESS